MFVQVLKVCSLRHKGQAFCFLWIHFKGLECWWHSIIIADVWAESHGTRVCGSELKDKRTGEPVKAVCTHKRPQAQHFPFADGCVLPSQPDPYLLLSN